MISSSSDVPPLSEIFSLVKFIIMDHMFALIVCAANMVSLGYAGTYYVITLYGMCKNSTYNEMANFGHYDYLCTDTDECEYVNPFDLGSISANVQEFLFGGRDWNTYSFTKLSQSKSKV